MCLLLLENIFSIRNVSDNLIKFEGLTTNTLFYSNRVRNGKQYKQNRHHFIIIILEEVKWAEVKHNVTYFQVGNERFEAK